MQHKDIISVYTGDGKEYVKARSQPHFHLIGAFDTSLLSGLCM